MFLWVVLIIIGILYIGMGSIYLYLRYEKSKLLKELKRLKKQNEADEHFRLIQSKRMQKNALIEFENPLVFKLNK